MLHTRNHTDVNPSENAAENPQWLLRCWLMVCDLCPYTRSPSQDAPSQDFRQGLGCSGTYLFIGSGVRLSRVWLRKDGNLLTETGCRRSSRWSSSRASPCTAPRAGRPGPAKPRRATKEGQRVLRTPLHIRTMVSENPGFAIRPLSPCLVGRCLQEGRRARQSFRAARARATGRRRGAQGDPQEDETYSISAWMNYTPAHHSWWATKVSSVFILLSAFCSTGSMWTTLVWHYLSNAMFSSEVANHAANSTSRIRQVMPQINKGVRIGRVALDKQRRPEEFNPQQFFVGASMPVTLREKM